MGISMQLHKTENSQAEPEIIIIIKICNKMTYKERLNKLQEFILKS